MKRITVTVTDEQANRLVRKSQRRGLPVSAIVRELIDNEEETRVSPFAAMFGLASKELPFSSAEIDQELEKSWAEAIRHGWPK